MAGFVLFWKSVLSIVICCILIVSSSKTATTHSGNVMPHAKKAQNENQFLLYLLSPNKARNPFL